MKQRLFILVPPTLRKTGGLGVLGPKQKPLQASIETARNGSYSRAHPTTDGWVTELVGPDGLLHTLKPKMLALKP